MTVVRGYGYSPRTRRRRRLAASVALILSFSALGVVLLQTGHGTTATNVAAGLAGDIPWSDGATAAIQAAGSDIVAKAANGSGGTASGNRLLRPYAVGVAPYAYLPHGAVTMSGYADASGVRNFFAAFILGSASDLRSGCTPLWDGASELGLASPRSAAILDDSTAIRKKGGDVAVSFGGEAGVELADSCTDAAKLQAAYRSVIDMYTLRHINFDIEGKARTNAAGLARRAQAAAALQRSAPDLKVSLTLPVETGGFDADTQNVIKTFRDSGVVLSDVGIMTMYFGGTGNESSRVIAATKAAASQLKQLYTGISTAEAYRALMVIPQLGVNQGSEVFTLADAQALRDFVTQNGVGSLSFWSVVRDQPCGSAVSTDMCSGISQTAYQFGRIMTRTSR